jgi:hypothetical protein
VEPPPQVADRRAVLPPFERRLQHLADALRGLVRGPSDSVTPRVHQGSFRLARRLAHHPQVPDSARRTYLRSLQLIARSVFKSRPPRKQVPGRPGEFRQLSPITAGIRPPPGAIARGCRVGLSATMTASIRRGRPPGPGDRHRNGPASWPISPDAIPPVLPLTYDAQLATAFAEGT